MSRKIDKILYGVKVGEHSLSADDLTDEIKTRVIDKGYNITYIRPHVLPDDPSEYFIKWAKYLAENKIYSFL